MLYSITHKFQGTQYSQTIEAATENDAYAQYAAEPGDFTNADDEPFDHDDLIIAVAGVYRAVGGTTFEIDYGGSFVGCVEAGDLDQEGQWVGDDDTVLEAARDAGLLPVNVTAIVEVL